MCSQKFTAVLRKISKKDILCFPIIKIHLAMSAPVFLIN